MGSRLFLVAVVPVMMIGSRVLQADTVVATINGYYDVDNYDTPSLHIDNSTNYAFTNVQLKLTSYQGLNKGISESVKLADITAASTGVLTWGSIPNVSGALTPGNLFSYDYDDEYGNTFSPQGGYGLNSSHKLVLAPQCVESWQYCAQVGNFYVTLTAVWNGKAIYSQFSPDPNLPGAGNVAGTFVGWEGLDPNGWAETTYDSHSNGGPNGVLADIVLGTPPTLAPEPASILLFGSAILLGMFGLYFRRFKSKLLS